MAEAAKPPLVLATPLLGDGTAGSLRPSGLRRGLLPFTFVAGVAVGTAVGVVVSSRWVMVPAASSQVATGHRTISSQPYELSALPAEPPEFYFRAPSMNNSCVREHMQVPPGQQTFDACGFVIRSIDELWNSRKNVSQVVHSDYGETFVNGGGLWGRRGSGRKELLESVLVDMRAFPDISAHVLGCNCKGNDAAGYECSVAATFDGTNIGSSSYGPATGRFARWSTMAVSIIRRDEATGRWQHVGVWGVRDTWSIVQQLRLDLARVPRRMEAARPHHRCFPLTTWHGDSGVQLTEFPSAEEGMGSSGTIS